jgi:G:T/U-mismatch repair DNA glycosylase
MGWKSKNKSQDKVVEQVRSADIDDKVEIVQEALKVAYENGTAEKLLRDVVHNECCPQC